MALPSEVSLTIGGVDVVRYALPGSTTFETLFNASPGACTIVLRDMDQELSFTTGDEIAMGLDGVPMWTGYVTGVRMGYFFPAVDTVTRSPSEVKERRWTLRGVDLNTLMDKRVFRNPANYLAAAPNFGRDVMDGALIREALTADKYFDIDDSEFDVTTEVDDIAPPFDPLSLAEPGDGAWPTQGTTLRAMLEEFASITGAVYYFSPSKTLHWKPLEELEADWGFSDVPGTDRIGFRDIDASEEGGPSTIINDALIWGGSEWSGTGQTVFARETDATSVGDYGRWQKAEVHFGQDYFKLQSGVDARANTIVHGTPTGTPITGFQPGMRWPQWMVTLTWSSHRVPRSGGVPLHLVAGNLVHIDLHTFAVGASPLELLLPLRRLEISFPAIPEEGGGADPPAWVQFRGSFGLQLSDPASLWRYLLSSGFGRARVGQPMGIVSGSGPATYGSLLSIEPTPTPDSVETVFDLPDDRGYIGGTTQVYVNGAFMRVGIDYTESDPNAGEITFTTAPTTGQWVWVICRVT